MSDDSDADTSPTDGASSQAPEGAPLTRQLSPPPYHSVRRPVVTLVPNAHVSEVDQQCVLL
jgi:hypothetical protein